MKIQTSQPLLRASAPRFYQEVGCRTTWSPRAMGLMVIAVMALTLTKAYAQDQRKRKIPVVDKISGGTSRQAFSGKVESLDLDRHVLEVNASEGKTMEIFPIKKGISVTSAAGEKMKLDQVKKGSNVIVYYDVRGDRRTVKVIVILTAAAEEEKKTSPPS